MLGCGPLKFDCSLMPATLQRLLFWIMQHLGDSIVKKGIRLKSGKSLKSKSTFKNRDQLRFFAPFPLKLLEMISAKVTHLPMI